MSKYDLNQIRDFSRVTMNLGQAIAGIVSAPDKWNIQEGSYNGVKFHILGSSGSILSDIAQIGAAILPHIEYDGALSQVQDSGGRRKAKYLFPYRDGQTTDDLGRKPETFEMDILIFGREYLDALRRLLTEFNKPEPGKLVHPVREEMNVVVDDYQLIHTHEKRKAVALRVTFSEHNFNVGDIVDNATLFSTIKGALTKALAVFSAIDRTVNDVANAVAFVKGLRDQINAAIAAYRQAVANILARMNLAFNPSGSQDIPGLLPTNQGGTGSPATGANFPVAVSPVNPLAAIPTGLSEAQRAEAQKIAKDVLNAAVAAQAALAAQAEAAAARADASAAEAAQAAAAAQAALAAQAELIAAGLSAAAALAASIDDIKREMVIVRQQLSDLLVAMAAMRGILKGRTILGSLYFHQNILDLKETGVILQKVLEAGIASSNARIISYTVGIYPMSIREVAFAVGLPLQRVNEIDILNPGLESVNYLAPGTVLRVPL